jgi:hypothetical protein
MKTVHPFAVIPERPLGRIRDLAAIKAPDKHKRFLG